MTVADLELRLRRTLPHARLEVDVLPDCDGIRLALINHDFPLGPLDPDVMRAVIAAPAYWAFCWGSGLALARYLLQTPERVRGRSVLDLGSGSGIAAIAAARAGAARVTACDIDPDARLATQVNAALNASAIDVVDSVRPDTRRFDLVLLADVLYDKANFGLLELAGDVADDVIIADSRIRELDQADYRETGRLEALTLPNLGEFDEFRLVRFFERITGATNSGNRVP
jgi:predicted nicotinamide N-methyase